MKTIHKLLLPALLIAGTVVAQEKKSKVCLKINEVRDGKATKLDTCFESSDPKEIDAFLERMGQKNMVVSCGKGEKKIVIMNKDEKDGNRNEYSYSYSTDGKTEGDPDLVMVMVDDNGNVTTTNGGNAKVIVKTVDGDGKDLDKEIEAAIKEADAEMKDGKAKKKEIKVIVTRKVVITDLSSDDKKTMPSDLQQVKGTAFEDLSVFPNPSKGNFSINYKGNTTEPLTIKLYDAMGKEVLMEKETSTDKDFTKNIDVSNLKKGVYFLHLSQGKKAEVKKVVITE
jgi:hypothetical protein